MRLNVAMSLSLRANLGCMNEIQPAGKHKMGKLYIYIYIYIYILGLHYLIEFPMQGYIDADG